MYVSAVRATGYRNLDGTVGLCHPLAIIVGENNAGKSSVIDALRTVLEPEAGPRARCWLREEDFAHDGHGTRIADELEIEVHLSDLNKAEQARMVTCLAPQAGLPPLRDTASDLRPGSDNKLISLVSALAPDGHTDRDAIVFLGIIISWPPHWSESCAWAAFGRTCLAWRGGSPSCVSARSVITGDELDLLTARVAQLRQELLDRRPVPAPTRPTWSASTRSKNEVEMIWAICDIDRSSQTLGTVRSIDGAVS